MIDVVLHLRALRTVEAAILGLIAGSLIMLAVMREPARPHKKGHRSCVTD